MYKILRQNCVRVTCTGKRCRVDRYLEFKEIRNVNILKTCFKFSRSIAIHNYILQIRISFEFRCTFCLTQVWIRNVTDFYQLFGLEIKETRKLTAAINWNVVLALSNVKYLLLIKIQTKGKVESWEGVGLGREFKFHL